MSLKADFGDESRPKQWIYRASPFLTDTIRCLAEVNIGIVPPSETGRLMGALDRGGVPVRISGWDTTTSSVKVTPCDYTQVEEFLGIATHGARAGKTIEVARNGEFWLPAGADIAVGQRVQMEDTDDGGATSDPYDIIPLRETYGSRTIVPGVTDGGADDNIDIGQPPIASLVTATLHDITSTTDELVPLDIIVLPTLPTGAGEIGLKADGKTVIMWDATTADHEIILGYKTSFARDLRMMAKAMSPATGRTGADRGDYGLVRLQMLQG